MKLVLGLLAFLTALVLKLVVIAVLVLCVYAVFRLISTRMDSPAKVEVEVGVQEDTESADSANAEDEEQKKKTTKKKE